jgi:hypothetical protein
MDWYEFVEAHKQQRAGMGMSKRTGKLISVSLVMDYLGAMTATLCFEE